MFQGKPIMVSSVTEILLYFIYYQVTFFFSFSDWIAAYYWFYVRRVWNPASFLLHESLSRVMTLRLSRSLRSDLGICAQRPDNQGGVCQKCCTCKSPDTLISLITMWHLPLHLRYLMHPFFVWTLIWHCVPLMKQTRRCDIYVLSKPQWWSVLRLEGPVCTVAGWEELFICSSYQSAVSLLLHTTSNPSCPILPPLLLSPSQCSVVWPNDCEIMRSEGTKWRSTMQLNMGTVTSSLLPISKLSFSPLPTGAH